MADIHLAVVHMCWLNDDRHPCREARKTKIFRDEIDVCRLIQCLSGNYFNSFATTDELDLIQKSNKRKASEAVLKASANAKSVGDMIVFVKERLVGHYRSFILAAVVICLGLIREVLAKFWSKICAAATYYFNQNAINVYTFLKYRKFLNITVYCFSDDSFEVISQDQTLAAHIQFDDSRTCEDWFLSIYQNIVSQNCFSVCA